ncbi:MAG: dephospho-CoA kinase [Candidatus Dormibacteraeota bacterium]|nr:dephospho-CoA kinase [Candidatus Dormibacteraeota bacterium]
MRLTGLTGGIATGKTTVAGMLTARGALVVDADVLAREVVAPGRPALLQIAAVFGPEALDAHGALNRAAVGRIVFADPRRRRQLEEITHPLISELMGARLAAALEGPSPLVVADIPLLFENARQSMFEGTLLVYAPEAEQLRRLVERDGLDEQEARQRLASQMPIDRKRELATWVIDNSGPLDQTDQAVGRWWERFVTGPG